MSELHWTQQEAIELATLVESIAPIYGCHVALTGGCLYKVGPRKDCDLVLYRIRQAEELDIGGLLGALEDVGLKTLRGFGFCYKCEYHGKKVDLLLPEEPEGIYPDAENGMEVI